MRAGVAAGVVAVVLALAACTGDDGQGPAPAPSGTGTSAGASPGATADGAPKGFERYYTQAIDWKKCDDGLQCATVEAPLSWQDASAGSITLALNKHAATGDRRGALLTNPGGPGGSGLELVQSATDMFSKAVLGAYDVIGMDPRGVGTSSPAVRCLDDDAKTRFLDAWYPRTTAGIEDATAEAKTWAQACAKNTGPLLGHVDTQSVARDLDMLRAVLGEKQLDYLGYSYGTQIGSTYAALFPTRVGRFVLDGALDPTLTSSQVTTGQAQGFENALRAYVRDCQSGSGCPLRGSGDAGVDEGMAQIHAFLGAVERTPLDSGDPARPLTATLAFSGIAVTLYDQSSWTYLTSALSAGFRGDGSQLLYLADVYNDRNQDGTYRTNSTEAFTAVNCLDDPGSADLADMQAEAAEIEKVAPTVGDFFSYGAITCQDWAYPQVKPLTDDQLHASGAAPIVVIGTTNDPATPYAWAQGLAKVLDSGVLVTYEGEGHTAYRASNRCIAKVVDAYLVGGDVPQDGVTCS